MHLTINYCECAFKNQRQWCPFALRVLWSSACQNIFCLKRASDESLCLYLGPGLLPRPKHLHRHDLCHCRNPRLACPSSLAPCILPDCLCDMRGWMWNLDVDWCSICTLVITVWCASPSGWGVVQYTRTHPTCTYSHTYRSVTIRSWPLFQIIN